MQNATSEPIRIATRASQLALWQANHISALLRQADAACEVEIVHVSTIGDRDQTESLQQFGGMGVFTREVQKAVLDGRADIAVHSLKDLPTESADGLTLAAIPERGPMFDVLALPISSETSEFADQNTDKLPMLPSGARVGTGSLRRRAQLLYHRGDLNLDEVRGNVETRLRKLDEGQFDALVLAAAGLQRLGLQDRISVELRHPLMFPAVGQGALGIECRTDDQTTLKILESLNHEPTRNAVTAERSLLANLRAGCHAPVGVMTRQTDDQLALEAVVLSADGQQRLIAISHASAAAATSLGTHVADELRNQGADALINSTN